MTPTSPEPVPRPAPVIVIIPIGFLDGAKSRLGSVLDAEERRDLVTDLARTTIAAAVASAGTAEVLVVTPDDEARAVALELGARPLRQRSRGLNAGIREARDEALAAGAGAILILPIDLPAVNAAAIEAVARVLAEQPPPLVGIVADRHGRGTNALLLAPADIIEVQFGGDSHDAHVAAARTAEAALIEIGGPLSIDLDTPEDLLLAQATLGPGAVIGG